MSNVPPAVSIILPTYNESESLRVIVPRIVATLRDAQLSCEVVVVDDASPDGTAQVAHELAAEYPVRVIERKTERGLATAVIAGFEAAAAPICVVMDADGSHPVAALPAMVRAIAEDKADVVVGSRNIAGGGSRNWPFFSQLKSKFAALLSFGLTSMTDPTTGLMALRKSLLRGLELDPVGWKIVLEVVVKAAPLRVAEVPIVFEDRELGESKQSLKVFAEYALHLGKLYAHRYPGLAELAKFCFVGLIGLVLDLSTVAAIKESTGLDTRLCAIFGFAVAVTANFGFNRYFTFARGRELPLLWSYLTYVGTNLLGLCVRMLTVHALMVFGNVDRGRGYLASNAIGILCATLFNFVGAKYFAFAPERLAPEARSTPVSEPPKPSKFSLPAAFAIAFVCASSVSRAAHAQTAVLAWLAAAFTFVIPFEAAPNASLYAALLLAGSPGFLASTGADTPDETLLAACAAGLYLAIEGTRRRALSLCLAGGFALGLGMLGAAWVALPYSFAACAFVLVQTTLGRAEDDRPLKLRRSVSVGALGFLLAYGARFAAQRFLSQLALPAALAASDFPLFSSAVGGDRPLWFYPLELYRRHFFLLPLLMFGLPALLRRTRPHAVVALALAFAAFLGLVVLSLCGFSRAGYELGAVPLLYLCAGTSLAELEADTTRDRPANLAVVKTVSALALAPVALAFVLFASGSTFVSARFAEMQAAGMVACFALGRLWIARRSFELGLVTWAAAGYLWFRFLGAS